MKLKSLSSARTRMYQLRLVGNNSKRHKRRWFTVEGWTSELYAKACWGCWASTWIQGDTGKLME